MLILLGCNHISTPFAFLLATFLLTHPLRGATAYRNMIKPAIHNFYSHTPCGVQQSTKEEIVETHDFYSHTPCGVQPGKSNFNTNALHFYSHTPCGVQQMPHTGHINAYIHFYSHTPCGVQQLCQLSVKLIKSISTHTPLAGCNYGGVVTRCGRVHYFYSHTPCGVQRCMCPYRPRPPLFLLTHPLRGATPYIVGMDAEQKFLLTHPLRGATAAVCRECDRLRFLLTHPLRGATRTTPTFTI